MEPIGALSLIVDLAREQKGLWSKIFGPFLSNFLNVAGVINDGFEAYKTSKECNSYHAWEAFVLGLIFTALQMVIVAFFSLAGGPLGWAAAWFVNVALEAMKNGILTLIKFDIQVHTCNKN